MRLRHLLLCLLAIVVLATPGVVALGGPAQADHGHHGQGHGKTQHDGKHGKNHGKKHGKKAKKHRAYRVAPGVVFNNPNRADQAGEVINKIKRTIWHVQPGERIWIMSWNFQGVGIARALAAAHRRGVGVRLIMARSLAWSQGPGGSFNVLKRALRTGNKGRPARQRSFVRTCENTCRGRGGAMHAKFMLVSRSGKTRHIVEQGSANFTTSAATNQWNDWYTVVEDKAIYDRWSRVFTEASRERPRPPEQFTQKHIYSWFAPRSGQPDPVMRLLNDVKCRGARGAGVNGRTAIRVASAVFQDDRGRRIADKLRRLYRKGCNVKVVYTLMSPRIREALGMIPSRQLVYDFDYDGIYDRYLHMKAMTISGRFRGDRGHRLVFNGSANWSWAGLISDEQGMVIHSDGLERAYSSHINWLFSVSPSYVRPAPLYRGARDPYHGLELELDVN